MATYVNKSLGVINVAGQFAAPGKTLEAEPKTPGLDRLLRRGALVEASAAKAAPKKDTSSTENTEQKK